MKYIIKFGTLPLLLLIMTGCRKFVQAPLPITELVGSNVFSSNSTATAAVTGIMTTMTENSVGGGPTGISALGGLSADEFILYPGATSLQQQVYINEQLSSNPPTIWSDLYNIIYQANAAINGIAGSPGVDSAMRLQLIGESEFLRAFAYFYLVNLYGDCPLVLTGNYQVTRTMGRTPAMDVYAQIAADLSGAQKMLGTNYLTPNGSVTPERVRPNAGAAAALLARVYLYEGKYDSAELEATAVINNSGYQLVQDLDSAFLASNSEAIWQLEIPDGGFNTPDAGAFLLSYFGGPSAYVPFILSDSLEYAFEPGDLRAVHWTDSITVGTTVYYFPFKYKLYYTGEPPTEYPTILRLAEQFLIRAEARAQQGNLVGTNSALSDVNVIRSRAGLAGSPAQTLPDMMSAIMKERRMELFTEYGHRWLDLKRTGTVNAVMTTVTPQKGGVWQASDSLWAIPLTDILSDANLIQNPGYN